MSPPTVCVGGPRRIHQVGFVVPRHWRISGIRGGKRIEWSVRGLRYLTLHRRGRRLRWRSGRRSCRPRAVQAKVSEKAVELAPIEENRDQAKLASAVAAEWVSLEDAPDLSSPAFAPLGFGIGRRCAGGDHDAHGGVAKQTLSHGWMSGPVISHGVLAAMRDVVGKRGKKFIAGKHCELGGRAPNNPEGRRREGAWRGRSPCRYRDCSESR